MPNENARQIAPSEPQADELDTSADEAEYAAANAELEQSQQAIDRGFAEYMAQNMPPEVEELFFAEDKTQFFLEVERLKEDFVNEKLTPTVSKIVSLEGRINDKKQKRMLRDVEREFLTAHPDADVKAIYEYLENDVSPRDQARIKSMSRLDGLNEVYKLMNRGESKGGELPERIEGDYNDSVSTGFDDSDLPTSRY